MESSFAVDPVIVYLFNLKEVLLPGKLGRGPALLKTGSSLIVYFAYTISK